MHVRDAWGAELAAVTAAVDLVGKRVLQFGSEHLVVEHASEVYFFNADRDCTPGETAAPEPEVKQLVRFAEHHANARDVERRRFDLALCGWSL